VLLEGGDGAFGGGGDLREGGKGRVDVGGEHGLEVGPKVVAVAVRVLEARKEVFDPRLDKSSTSRVNHKRRANAPLLQ
jgi:hypothetical protein